MQLTAYDKTVGSIFDAVLDERQTPIALEAVANYVGASSVSYSLVNKFTRRVSTSVLWGSFTNSRADYLAHYSKIDPYLAIVGEAACGKLALLSERLPQSQLRSDEWYNDFVLTGGTCDLLGGKLHESSSHIAAIGVHRAVGEFHSRPTQADRLQSLIGALCNAARLHVGLIDIGYRSPSTHGGLDHLAVGAIFTDGEGEIIETNQAGEEILRAGDGLTMLKGRISARRSFETSKLVHLIAGAATANRGAPSAGCMLVARDSGEAPYVVRVAPAAAGFSGHDLPLAMLLISSVDEKRVSARELAELYGLSPAEGRIALALSCGKRLSDLVGEFGVQITTLRTQLSSILRKCEVERQSDLVRLISNIAVARPVQSETARAGLTARRATGG